MKIIKLSLAIFAISLFFLGCNSNQTPPTATTAPQTYPNDQEFIETEGDEYWAKDNFDLQRVGNLLERAESPEQFERYLNQDDGINNLDMNGDGYADYISVEEFDDRDSNSRGLSLFSRFGPDLIQEIATVFLYRDEPRYPGARFLIRGNDQIYGDNNYYETNWLDRGLQIASSLFADHDPYRSPYYYDNYPSWYTPYDIVEVPVYRTRVAQLYPQPVFVYSASPPAYFEKIKIKSPNNGLHLGQIHAKLVKPTKAQDDFLKGNPGLAKFVKNDKGGRRNDVARGGDDKPGRDNPPRSDRGEERGNPGRDDRGAERGNPNKPAAQNPGQGRQDMKPAKTDNPGAGNPNKGGGNPNKADGNPNKGGGNPNKGGGNPNKGGGNPNKGGGQGGGKGGGKKP